MSKSHLTRTHIYTRIIFFWVMFLTTKYSFCQFIQKEDTIGIQHIIEKTFLVLETPVFRYFKSISASSLYCSPCFQKSRSLKKPNMIGRKFFFRQMEWGEMRNEILLAKKSEHIKFEISKGDHRSDVIVLFSIPNEKESSIKQQLGLYFKKFDGVFRFSGMEVIP